MIDSIIKTIIGYSATILTCSLAIFVVWAIIYIGAKLCLKFEQSKHPKE